MKQSYYNFIWPLDGKASTLTFNCITGALAEMDQKTLDILNKIETIDVDKLDVGDKETVKAMEDNGFIVDSCVDEYKILKFRYNNAKYDKSKMNLTIAPTLDCNFRCFYCYQERIPGSITTDIKNAILGFVEESAGHLDQLNVSWYGGEPMMDIDSILEMSNQFIAMSQQFKFAYQASMITNGFLFDSRNIEKFKMAHLNDVQITVDGPAEIHNKRRTLLENNSETFERIIENIKLLRKADINVTIRINLDKSNSLAMDQLLDVLVAHGLRDINVYLGQVKLYTEICKNFENLCLGRKEISDLDFELQILLQKKGFHPVSNLFYPEVKGSYCCTDHNNSFVINYNGDMYKCWGELGNTERSIGNILHFKLDDNKKMLMNYIHWMSWEPFENSECRECKILPVCMGGCPYAGFVINQGTPECIKWKLSLEKTIKLQYEAMTSNL